jgi:hypothetical protein
MSSGLTTANPPSTDPANVPWVCIPTKCIDLKNSMIFYSSYFRKLEKAFHVWYIVPIRIIKKKVVCIKQVCCSGIYVKYSYMIDANKQCYVAHHRAICNK